MYLFEWLYTDLTLLTLSALFKMVSRLVLLPCYWSFYKSCYCVDQFFHKIPGFFKRRIWHFGPCLAFRNSSFVFLCLSFQSLSSLHSLTEVILGCLTDDFCSKDVGSHIQLFFLLQMYLLHSFSLNWANFVKTTNWLKHIIFKNMCFSDSQLLSLLLRNAVHQDNLRWKSMDFCALNWEIV